jgi:hypothetical protein
MLNIKTIESYHITLFDLYLTFLNLTLLRNWTQAVSSQFLTTGAMIRPKVQWTKAPGEVITEHFGFLLSVKPVICPVLYTFFIVLGW